MEFQIFVRNVTGKTITITVTNTMPVTALKELVQEKTNIFVENQRLIYGGKQLEDDKVISDYNIVAEATLHLVFRLLGGRIEPNTSPIETGRRLIGEKKPCYYFEYPTNVSCLFTQSSLANTLHISQFLRTHK